MAIVALGSLPMVVGALPSVFQPFNYDQNLAYSGFALFTVDNINNIFSRIQIRGLINIPGLPAYLADEIVELPITATPVSFYYPFSPLMLGNGSCTFIAERLSNIRGTAESDSAVTLSLFYEDAITVPSWRA